jgi:thymidylate synthase (FAD)
MRLVRPKVYLVGKTELDKDEVLRYLRDSGNEDFITSMNAAEVAGLTGGEIMCSLFAKLCYKSLTLGKNANVTRIRDIVDNLKGCFAVGHGSIFEHIYFNFIISDCSRVMTHELVRHRVGTAFSQNSGRYIRVDKIDLVFDPILEPVREEIESLVTYIEDQYAQICDKAGLNDAKDFETKKKLTSALRRIAPNGQSNEIGFSINLRSLRHTIMLRTSRHAEWEIRYVFAEIYRIMKERYPLMFCDAKESIYDGIIEVTGMRMQPYETNEDAIVNAPTNVIMEELSKRTQRS